MYVFLTDQLQGKEREGRMTQRTTVLCERTFAWQTM